MRVRKRKGRPRSRVVGDPNDPQCMGAWMTRYLEWMAVRNYSPESQRIHRSAVSFFVLWCEQRSLTRPEHVTRPILEQYQRHLFYYRKADGRPLSFRSQNSRLVPVRGYFRWLVRQNVLQLNPASDLELPKAERRLPRDILTQAEAEAVIATADVSEPLGLRNRAIFETFYSTGIRRKELACLSVYDLDAERGTLMVRHGKGGTQRMVPIGERASAWVQTYVQEVRPELVLSPDDGTLFLSSYGESMTLQALTKLVREALAQAGIGKAGGCHLFRHTMATLMLEHGADVRFIQQMLGHADLSSTQIYTHVSIRQLQRVHALTHPAASLNGPASPAALLRRAMRDEVEHNKPPTAQDVLSSLAAEEAEEDDDGEERR